MRAIPIVLALLAPAALARDVLIRDGLVYTGTGAEASVASVLISEGRIVRIAPDIAPSSGALVLSAKGKVVCPGFVDAHCQLGLRPGEHSETVLPASDDTTPWAAFRADAPAVRASLAAGVTTVLLAPGAGNPVAGPGCVVSLSSGEALVPAASMHLSLSPEALRWDRVPTSLTGLWELVRATLTEARSMSGTAPIALAVRGEIPVQVRCGGLVDAEGAAGLAREFDLRASVLVPSSPAKLPEALAGSGLTALVADLARSPLERSLSLPARLEAKQVPFAFASMAGGDRASDVRTSAVLAVSRGLSAEGALRALTLGAAEAIGAEALLGSLEPGKRGDLLILSGEPTDLASAVEVVLSGGEVVWERGQR